MAAGKFASKTIIGRREWCEFPDLGLPGVLAKVDTGAKTSTLHAFRIRPFQRDGEQWVSFAVHPVRRRRRPEIHTEARVVDERKVTSSNGETERRLVIATTMVLGSHRFMSELTLTNRDEMGYRMLLGRQSLARRFVVDPVLSLALGDRDESRLYPQLIDSGEDS